MLKDKLNIAFRNMRKQGITARQNFSCCGSCAVAQFADEAEAKGVKFKDVKFVYYHMQDTANLKERGELYLGHSGKGVAKLAVKILREAGIQVEWDGTSGQRIHCSEKKETSEEIYIRDAEEKLEAFMSRL